jgi:hypothetical protein
LSVQLVDCLKESIGRIEELIEQLRHARAEGKFSCAVNIFMNIKQLVNQISPVEFNGGNPDALKIPDNPTKETL